MYDSRTEEVQCRTRAKLTSQVFARKLIRLFGGVTREDIESEAGAISRLCRPGGSKFVVEVMRHGWLPRNPSYYYIDMEFCNLNLHVYIYGDRSICSEPPDSNDPVTVEDA